jgi:hypothetical protein
MKFSTGFFEGLFGKKTTLQVPQDDGTTKEVPVTEVWLNQMRAGGTSGLAPCGSGSPGRQDPRRRNPGVDRIGQAARPPGGSTGAGRPGESPANASTIQRNAESRFEDHHPGPER